MTWIIRYKSGKTVTQKDEDYADLEHDKITSLQLKYRGTYYTISKTDDSQRFFQQRAGLKMMGINRDTSNIKQLPLIKQHILCIYNNAGDCIGWEIDYRTQEVKEVNYNVLDMRTNLKIFDIPHTVHVELSTDENGDEVSKIRYELFSFEGEKLPILTSYKMKGESHSAVVGVNITHDKV